MEFIKKHVIVIIAIALPLLFILGVVAVVYVPKTPLTRYDFVYAICQSSNRNTGYAYGSGFDEQCPLNLFDITDERIVIHDEKLSATVKTGVGVSEIVEFQYRLFVHDTAKNENREITFEEAKKLRLNALLVSPDGASLGYGYSRGGSGGLVGEIVGSSGSRYGYYFEKNNKRQEVQLFGNTDYYSGQRSTFVGWVTSDVVD